MIFVKKRQLRWFCRISRSSGLAKTILQGTVQGKRKKVDRKRGRKTILRSGQGWNLLAQLFWCQLVKQFGCDGYLKLSLNFNGKLVLNAPEVQI